MQKARASWPELDILRGFAVVLMILSHAGVAWMDDAGCETGLSGWLTYLGGFAPVVFFFVTGLGNGLAHQVGRPARSKDLLIKAGILILADVFMRGGSFLAFGWDFLGFIGISMLVLHAFRGRRYGVIAAVIAMVVVLLLRYGGAPLYARMVPPDQQVTWIRVALGAQSVDSISYWFTPWLAYPLGGFLTGVIARRFEPFYLQHRALVVSLLAIAGLAMLGPVVWLDHREALFHRWGTMSLAFFVATIPLLLLSLAGAGWIARRGEDAPLVRAMSLRGISSLAVVPIHYAILQLIERFADLPAPPIYYYCGAPLLILVSFQLARMTDRRAQRIARAASPQLPKIMLLVIAALGALTTTLRPAQWIDAACFVAGLMLCVMLAFSYSGRKPQPAPEPHKSASPAGR